MTNLRCRPKVTGRRVFAFIVCVVLSGPVLGQSANDAPEKAFEHPEFESAKISPSADFVTSVGGPPGRFEAKNVTAKMLVQLAFNLPADQVSGGPPWAASQRFDVTAKISDAQWQDLNKLGDSLRNQLIQHMLQALVVERFHLAISHQEKDLLVFALVTAKSGAKLQVAGTPKPESIGRELVMSMDQDDAPVSALANALSAHFGRTVLDNTGLSRRYDIRLRVEIPDENSPEAVDRAIFTALEDQLGLKLVTRRRVLDTIVIDQLEQPTDN